jgi:hypothetical protein
MHNGALNHMSDEKQTRSEAEPQRIKFTARLTLTAYDAIAEIQRRYRNKTGRVLPLWKVLDAAIIAYARGQGIKVNDQ